MSEYLLSTEFRFDTMLSSNLGKETSYADRGKCPRVLNSMHLAKPAAFVRVYSVDTSIVDKSLMDDLVFCQQEGAEPQSQRVPGSSSMQWNKISGWDLYLKNISPFISGVSNAGQLQLCLRDCCLRLCITWSCQRFTKTLVFHPGWLSCSILKWGHPSKYATEKWVRELDTVRCTAIILNNSKYIICL